MSGCLVCKQWGRNHPLNLCMENDSMWWLKCSELSGNILIQC